MIQPWWENDPERWALEIQALKDADYSCEVDEGYQAQGVGVLRFGATISGGESLQGLIIFPPEYPEFPPTINVSRDVIQLHHHQNLYGNLCMAGGTDGWWPGRTVAEYLDEFLEKNIRSGRGEEGFTGPETEVDQAEPHSVYMNTLNHTFKHLLYDDSLLIPEENKGTFEVGARAEIVNGNEQAWFIIRALKAGTATQKTVRWESPESLQAIYETKKNLKGCWYYLDKAPLDLVGHPKNLHSYLSGQGINIQGILQVREETLIVLFFPEENRLRTGGGLGATAYFIKPLKKKLVANIIHINTQRYSSETLAQRLPLFEGMQQAKVVVCGLGSLGSPIAIELSRAGVGDLRLVDHDSIEAGTTVRYALGLNYAGVSKVGALAEYIHKNYPFTRITPVDIRLGATQVPNLPEPFHEISSDVDHLGKIHDCLDGADLIIDASAEDRVNSYLSTEAHRLGIPYITLAGTYGMWGGEVLRVRPGQCWSCFKWSQVDQDPESIPDPPQDPNAKVQPKGCRAVTFQGAGFDGGEISLMATRFAISTLVEKYAPGTYPEIAEDGAILSIRDETGAFQFANWKPFKLEKHEDCRVNCRFDQ